MPTKLLPARWAGQRSTSARPTARPRRTLRTLLFAGLTLGLLLPGSAVRADPSPAEIQKRITKEGAALEKVIEEYNKVNEELKTTTLAAKKHAATLPTLQAKYAEMESQMSVIAANAYKAGSLREANAMLNGGGGNALLDRISSLDQVARGRQAQIDDYTTARNHYESEKRRLDVALAKQRIQKRDLTVRKKRIESDLKKLYEMRRKAYGQAQESGGRYTGNIPASAPTAVRYAYNAIGSPYVANADGPYSSGYDCSGLTMAAWRAAGKSLPHNAASQWSATGRISRSQLQPGDLVFYSGLGHVAIYVGSGQIIHAPQPGETVKLASMDIMSVYGYGRVG